MCDMTASDSFVLHHLCEGMYRKGHGCNSCFKFFSFYIFCVFLYFQALTTSLLTTRNVTSVRHPSLPHPWLTGPLLLAIAPSCSAPSGDPQKYSNISLYLHSISTSTAPIVSSCWSQDNSSVLFIFSSVYSH